MINPGLDGKVVMVTGANNPYGIGAAVAKAFAEQGAKIFLHYFRHKRPEFMTGACVPSPPSAEFYRLQQSLTADEVLTMIQTVGVRACALEADLSDPLQSPYCSIRRKNLLAQLKCSLTTQPIGRRTRFCRPMPN